MNNFTYDYRKERENLAVNRLTNSFLCDLHWVKTLHFICFVYIDIKHNDVIKFDKSDMITRF